MGGALLAFFTPAEAYGGFQKASYASGATCWPLRILISSLSKSRTHLGMEPIVPESPGGPRVPSLKTNKPLTYIVSGYIVSGQPRAHRKILSETNKTNKTKPGVSE